MQEEHSGASEYDGSLLFLLPACGARPRREDGNRCAGELVGRVRGELLPSGCRHGSPGLQQLLLNVTPGPPLPGLARVWSEPPSPLTLPLHVPHSVSLAWSQVKLKELCSCPLLLRNFL